MDGVHETSPPWGVVGHKHHRADACPRANPPTHDRRMRGSIGGGWRKERGAIRAASEVRWLRLEGGGSRLSRFFSIKWFF